MFDNHSLSHCRHPAPSASSPWQPEPPPSPARVLVRVLVSRRSAWCSDAQLVALPTATVGRCSLEPGSLYDMDTHSNTVMYNKECVHDNNLLYSH